MILRGFCGREDSAAVSLAHAIEAAANALGLLLMIAAMLAFGGPADQEAVDMHV